MKKVFFLGAASALLALSSCNSSGSSLEQSFGIPCLNLVDDATTFDEEGSMIVPSTYAFHINYTDTRMDVSVSNLELGDSKLTFGIENLLYTSSQFEMKANSTVVPTSDSVDPVRNLSIRLSNLVISNPTNVTGDTPFYNSTAAILSYTWKNYTVRTFPADAVYLGSTTTTAPGNEDYITSDPTYRFIVNTKDMSVTLFIYNGKFSSNPKSPSLNLKLEGLKIAPNRTGYTISGTDVVPQTLAEGTPYPSYTFSNIEFNTLATDLTSGKLTFSIASPMGELTGTFSGSYLLDPSQIR